MSEIQKQQVAKLIEKREIARMGGGEKAIQKQHEKGKYTGLYRNSRFTLFLACRQDLQGDGYGYA